MLHTHPHEITLTFPITACSEAIQIQLKQLGLNLKVAEVNNTTRLILTAPTTAHFRSIKNAPEQTSWYYQDVLIVKIITANKDAFTYEFSGELHGAEEISWKNYLQAAQKAQPSPLTNAHKARNLFEILCGHIENKKPELFLNIVNTIYENNYQHVFSILENTQETTNYKDKLIQKLIEHQQYNILDQMYVSLSAPDSASSTANQFSNYTQQIVACLKKLNVEPHVMLGNHYRFIALKEEITKHIHAYQNGAKHSGSIGMGKRALLLQAGLAQLEKKLTTLNQQSPVKFLSINQLLYHIKFELPDNTISSCCFASSIAKQQEYSLFDLLKKPRYFDFFGRTTTTSKTVEQWVNTVNPSYDRPLKS